MAKTKFEALRDKVNRLGLVNNIETEIKPTLSTSSKTQDKWGFIRISYATPIARKLAEELNLNSAEDWLKAYDENKIIKELPREPDKYYKTFQSWDYWLNTSKKKTWNSNKNKEWKKYKAQVWKLTEEQPLKLLENFEKRGYRNFHLDHIISIWDGFKNGFKPEDIADISNLRFIPDKQNMLKGRKSE